MFGAPQKKIDSIDKYRYLSFVKNTRNSKRVPLSCLPPTCATAHKHLCRVYYQVQVWLGNELDPENWGWVLKDNGLEPFQTLLPSAPEKLTNTIFCQFCSNVESNTTEEDAYDINEEISDPSYFLEQSIEIQQQGEEEESVEKHITVEEFEDYLDDS
ncbi:hypothetical protein AVEN_220955-1 [Araneus ventricosus]|uniref:Uncharacterized protein n=1 Tax=Araneus ventricosus TaxID=182803 RepID=A0A4Y2HAI9_ARAVE|nr:hypothetical protein AVEN_220955-1 [Araneus ventricosus]